MKKYINWQRAWFALMAVWVVVVICQLILPFAPKDDSDSPTARSGMLVLTDHLTGCQYLATARGGITPRWTRDGEQVCK